jgi:disulfide bond formation protein DsbB
METLPIGEALSVIFTGSGECATIDWLFLGLSMPAWVLISVAVVGGAGIWNNLRSTRLNTGSIQ